MSGDTKPGAAEPRKRRRTKGQKNAHASVQASINAAVVMEAYQGSFLGKELDLVELVERLQASMGAVKDGDLSNLEAMLIGQATALQTMFTSLARRAQVQESQRHLESLLTLAFKAQAQSRATIQAVVDLKYPRQVAFVKQANISHGPQQVNNGPTGIPTHARTRAEEIQPEQSKLLEDKSHERTYLDAGATDAAGRSDPTLEAVETVNRPEKRRG